MTVAEYALDTYLPNRPHNANSHEHVRSMIANHIVGTKLGSRRLGDVRTSEVRGWANERWEALSPSTAAKTLGLLRSVYAAALEDRLLKVSPVTRSVKLPRAPKPRISVLGVEEVARIQAAMVEVRAAAEMMVEVQGRLGLRPGELFGLRVADVNFLHHEVMVTCQLTGNSRTRVKPKTPKSVRTSTCPRVSPGISPGTSKSTAAAGTTACSARMRGCPTRRSSTGGCSPGRSRPPGWSSATRARGRRTTCDTTTPRRCWPTGCRR